jgi:uncharacterized protein involved in exopolysaccharide biosynthesis
MINDELDIGLLLAISRQNVLAIVILFTFFAFVAFLYLRFTPPVYQSVATVQLGYDTRTNALLQTSNIYSQTIHQEIEFLRSPVSIKSSLSKLPIDVSYMIKGEVLSTELYATSPFTIKYNILNPGIYNQAINLNFLDNYRVYIEYTLGDRLVGMESSILDTIKTEDVEIQILVNNYERIIENQNEDQNQFFLIINSEEHNLNKYLAKLKVEILNEFAKTINVKVKDHNAIKARDMVNQIAEDFITGDERRKRKSANSVLEFIDSQLAKIYDRLYDSENKIQSFKKLHGIDENTDKKKIEVYRM